MENAIPITWLRQKSKRFVPIWPWTRDVIRAIRSAQSPGVMTRHEMPSVLILASGVHGLVARLSP